MQNQNKIMLASSEAAKLKSFLKKGNHSARTIYRAKTLLMADRNGKKNGNGNGAKTNAQISKELNLAHSTPRDIKNRYHEGGLERALYDAPRSGQPRIATAKEEAEIVAIACSDPKEGYSRWTLDLITERIKEKFPDRKKPLKRTTIHNILLRNELKPWREKNVVHC